MLTAVFDRTNVGGLQHWRYVRTGHGAAPVVGVENYSPKRVLAETIGGQPWIAEHGSRPMPRLAQVQVDGNSQDAVQHIREVRRIQRIGEIVAFSLDDIRRKARWCRRSGIFSEEANIPNKQAADHGILAGNYRLASVVRDAAQHAF